MTDLLTLPDGRLAQLWLGGAEAGPVVLFFHGCPDTRWAARFGEAAARDAGVRLLCVNRPGYGRSARAESSYASVADDAVAVLDLLGIEEVACLGMSVGGGYAAAFTVRHPTRVRSLGIVATLPMPDAPAEGSVADAMERARPEFEAWVAGIDATDTDDAALAERWAGSLPDQDAALVRGLPAADVAASAREALADHDGFLRDAALLHRPWDVHVSAIACPTHLWYGDEDGRALPGAEWFAAQVPHASVVRRPGTTHLATLAAHWLDILATLTTATPVEAAILRTRSARALGLREQYDAALAELDDIAASVPGSTSEEVGVRVALERGRVLRSSGSIQAARPHFEEAVTRAGAAGMQALEIDALHMVALVAPADEQLAVTERALALARGATEQEAIDWDASLLNNIGMTHADAGDFTSALASFEEALAARRRIGDDARTRVARWMVGWALRNLGRRDEARAIQLALKADLVAAGEEDPYVDEELGLLDG